MTPAFNPFEFVEFAKNRWRTAAVIAGCALATALLVSLVLPKKYTATATLVIEPPGGSDPRISTAVSPVYLESLKTYEQFASSDSLFAEACAKFGLPPGGGTAPIESFKKRVLQVRKPKETKLLQIAVTLRDAKQAQMLVQYLAERTVNLSGTLAADGEGGSLQEWRARAAEAKEQTAKVEQDMLASASAGQQAALEAELRALAELQSQVTGSLAETQARIAEYAARESRGEGSAASQAFVREELAAYRAKATALEASRAGVARDIAAKSSALSGLQARRDQLHSRMRAAQTESDLAVKRLNEIEASVGMRAERLRIVDPGIVPQRPSSPDIPLNCAAALALGMVAAVFYLAMQFGLEKQRARYARVSIAVAQRDSA